MRILGIERLSVFGMPPVEYVALAADLGCSCVGMGLAPTGDFNPHGYRDWSLRDDAALRRETRTALADCDVKLALLEGFAVVPGKDLLEGYARDMDVLAELGGERIAVVSLDKDIGCTISGFAAIAELAAARGFAVSAEVGSLGPIADVDSALAVARGVGLANFTLLLDTMHYFRLGNTVADLGRVPAAMIGYIQLCDTPWQPRFDTYIEEAMYERMVPGEGELPLDEFIAAMPADIVVSLEIPMRSLALAGSGPRERLAPCVAAARAKLAAAEHVADL